jgi:hypothetical protein
MHEESHAQSSHEYTGRANYRDDELQNHSRQKRTSTDQYCEPHIQDYHATIIDNYQHSINSSISLQDQHIHNSTWPNTSNQLINTEMVDSEQTNIPCVPRPHNNVYNTTIPPCNNTYSENELYTDVSRNSVYAGSSYIASQYLHPHTGLSPRRSQQPQRFMHQKF